MARHRRCERQADGRGDQRSHEIEAHGAVIMELIQAKADLTLSEICEALAAKGIKASRSALWRFFERHSVSFKKKRRMPPNKNALMSSPHAKRGASNA